ncbi:glycogen/starch/alpha-glucan phosphorylase [Nitrosococcus wardiae]|uniref:Alpha-1,4 glucan phosphorylase n=1 Tax=Nitrosococcus wardiae TaxID=1814290 RepID=A0A4P7BXW2_9GAMM|nr:glycogen/starch/alpha-glucan phosphorylase [Nitrosococcus wardiae]QBQ55018.1 glycogen/starch/alpha-glucan phosphorylase [Nitrosococcus wardiae]
MPTRYVCNIIPPSKLTELPPLGMDRDSLANDYKGYFGRFLGRDESCVSKHYLYFALALTIRDRLMERWKSTNRAYDESNCSRTYYLSMEYLLGRCLGNAMLNLGLDDQMHEALEKYGLDLEELAELEHDAGLGNGGLGRLAACFLDSCATLQLPVRGYGLRYEYGMFRQEFNNGYQVEEPDHWLRDGNPWELERPEYTQRIKFGGRTEHVDDGHGGWRVRWVNSHDVLAVPYDIPIPGYRNGTVNTLRLWKAEATDVFDLGEFNAGRYPESVAAKNAAENITMVLYPNDAMELGKETRLRQQYFLTSASLQDILRDWVRRYGEDFSQFAEKNRFQLNDTHPTSVVPELMRLLMDEHGLGWDKAWEITSHTVAYTNHTLLPEALEKWPVSLFGSLLPRLLEIIYEINARFLIEVARCWPGDTDRQARMSIIEEGESQQVRMAHLAIVASFSVNGVAALHTRLLKHGLFHDFYQIWPHKFNNKTNGVTPRRWLAKCNPDLARLITETIGDGWTTDLSQLRRLSLHAENPEFRARWRSIKYANKRRLLALQAQYGIQVDTHFLFDVQVKRIHEYKRQLLNVLHIIHLYDRIKRGDMEGWVPRCVLISGKAAPGYWMAKLIIKLINNVADVVNHDPKADEALKVFFLPNYGVSAMEIICPGADLSEQISTAGKEASGTGNMKFMMNGAITIGTLDGANIEILEEVGNENFFLFGLKAEEVEAARHHYDPNAIIASDEELQRVIHLLECGHFNQFEPRIFDPILHALRSPLDPWMTIADFRSYIDAQRRVAEAYRDEERWTRMAILNTAASGRFSTDRTIKEYNADIWRLEQIPAYSVGSTQSGP